jgi:endonuclease YncB( thermonuclease family)
MLDRRVKVETPLAEIKAFRKQSRRRVRPPSRWRARVANLPAWLLIGGVLALVGGLAIHDRRAGRTGGAEVSSAVAATPTPSAPDSIDASAVAVGSDTVLVGRVTKVTDGDTLKVELSSGVITVRLDGVDAPEKDQPWGREAATALAALVLDREVELDVKTQDRYDRLVAAVTIGTVNVNEQLLQGGHAWAFRRYLARSQAAYCRYEADARSARRGLWSLDRADWVYPSDWRRVQRGQLRELQDFSRETAESCVAAIGER